MEYLMGGKLEIFNRIKKCFFVVLEPIPKVSITFYWFVFLFVAYATK
jgi:hypothetical protein